MKLNTYLAKCAPKLNKTNKITQLNDFLMQLQKMKDTDKK